MELPGLSLYLLDFRPNWCYGSVERFEFEADLSFPIFFPFLKIRLFDFVVVIFFSFFFHIKRLISYLSLK